MRAFYPVLATLMVIVTAYFTYMIINVLVTMIKAKRKDHSLKICLTTAGKAFYIIITILYILLVIGGAAFGIHSALNGSNLYLNGISTVALASLLYAFQIANIVLVGKKNVLIGRLLVVYRKMKKIDLNNRREMTFVYAQKSFSFSTRWVDIALLRRSISRRS